MYLWNTHVEQAKTQAVGMGRAERRAFTLVELLVVVTIIVTLLALLVPAMDQAIYQTELAVCAANQRAVGTSVIAYASGYKRYYPYRQGVRSDTVWPEACIYNGNAAFQAFANGAQADTNATGTTVYNDKPILSAFLSLNGHLNDPMVKKVNYDISDDNAHNYSTYNLWFGYQFWEDGQAFKGMKKIGDRLTYRQNAAADSPTWRLDLLVSDRDTINNVADPGKRVVQSSHPNKDGNGKNLHLQNTDWVAGMKFVASWWESNGAGTVDLNFTFQDGSVNRYNVVGNTTTDLGRYDVRDDSAMGRVPESNLGFNGWWVTVPPQR